MKKIKLLAILQYIRNPSDLYQLNIFIAKWRLDPPCHNNPGQWDKLTVARSTAKERISYGIRLDCSSAAFLLVHNSNLSNPLKHESQEMSLVVLT